MNPLHDMMGGAFGLDLPLINDFPYTEGPCCAFVNSGRAALEQILSARRPAGTVWVPRFACDTLLQPMHRLELPVRRYGITDDLSPVLPETEKGDIIILINYFGLTGASAVRAAADAEVPCIIDDTTALYATPPPGIPCFYSPRKFLAVPDGGVAHSPFPLPLPQEEDRSAERALALLLRTEDGAQAATDTTERAERELCGPPKRMSPLTRRLLASQPCRRAAAARCANYTQLHKALASVNRLTLPETPPSAPFCYPLLTGIPGLRDELIDAGIALPLFWPEVIAATEASDTENRLARTLLPLPVDQRYTAADMERLIRCILSPN
ncbi:MAG: hypothetical protein MR894_04180 [Akkermansia muciniphila]|nr:hypothetical protein [Akkermansia muciniphila]